jgi:hypothetical protein
MDLNDFGAEEIISNSNANTDDMSQVTQTSSGSTKHSSSAMVVNSPLGSISTFNKDSWVPQAGLVPLEDFQSSAVTVVDQNGAAITGNLAIYQLEFTDYDLLALWSHDDNILLGEVKKDSAGNWEIQADQNGPSDLGPIADFDIDTWQPIDGKVPHADLASGSLLDSDGNTMAGSFEVHELTFSGDAHMFVVWSKDNSAVVGEADSKDGSPWQLKADSGSVSTLGDYVDFIAADWAPAVGQTPYDDLKSAGATLDDTAVQGDLAVYSMVFNDKSTYLVWSNDDNKVVSEVEEMYTGKWRSLAPEGDSTGGNTGGHSGDTTGSGTTGSDTTGSDTTGNGSSGSDDGGGFAMPLQVVDDDSSQYNGRILISDKTAVQYTVDASGNPTQSNNSNYILDLQMLGQDLAVAEMYDPAWISELQSAKGLIVLDNSNAASFTFDADLVAGIGYATGSAKTVMAWGSATDTIRFVGDDWVKVSLAGTEYKTMVNSNKSRGESFDVYESQVNGQIVAVIVQNTMQTSFGSDADTDTDIAQQFMAYNGVTEEQATAMGISTTEEYDLEGNEDADNTIVLSVKEGAEKGQLVKAGAGADTVTGTAKSDTIRGDAGNDSLTAGAGSDNIWGGTGDDTIDGGDGGNQGHFWEDADHVYFEGNRDDYTISQTIVGGKSTFTVKDNTADRDGTDTITNVEIAHFADDEVLLAAETNSWSYTDWATNQEVTEDFTRGTDFDDTISGSAGRSIIEGGDGNDVILGEAATSTTGSADRLSGGGGNDFMDGALRGTSAFEWENDNAAEYWSASRNYVVEKIIYSGAGATTLDATLSTMGMTDRVTLNVDQEYFVVTDARTTADATKGTGIDIITNIDQLFFDDKDMRLSVFKDPLGGFIEGTRFGDTIVGSAASEWIESGKGHDIVDGGDGADEARLGQGNDFFDGGAHATDSFNLQTFFQDFGDEWANVDLGFMGEEFEDIKFDDFQGTDDGKHEGSANATAGDPNAGGGHHEPPQNNQGHDVAFYKGNFDRYTISIYKFAKTDSTATLDAVITTHFSSAVQTKVDDLMTGLADGESLNFIVVEDSQTRKGDGIDLLVNVEKLQFADMTFNATVTQEVNDWGWPGPEVQWNGTFGDDIINFNALETDADGKINGKLATEYQDIDWDGTADPLENDRMYGEAGDDVLIAGAGGDRLDGGVGNDIMDGGANGSASFANDPWMKQEANYDVAEYNADIDRFELTKHTFVGKNMALKDQDGNVIYKVTTATKGSDTIGQITRTGSDEVVYQIDKGTTFYVVADSLPGTYGGYGTDILLGMESARFGYDWDGHVSFQVDYRVDSWGNGEGQVNADGTQFADVIDLRAGKTSTQAGFGGLDDFNDGMDIWDAGFMDAQDNKLSEEVAGFDLWNWTPGEADIATAEGVTAITGIDEVTVIAGNFAIYTGIDKTTDNPDGKTVAFDVDGGWVFGEVAQDGTGWKEDYAGYTYDADASNSQDTYGWQPVDGDSAVATNVKIQRDDGFVEQDSFDIYDINAGNPASYVAYNSDWGFVFEAVTQNDAGSWVVTHVEGMTDFEEKDDFDWHWKPSDNDSADAVTSIYWKSFDEGEPDYEVTGTWDIYEIEDGAPFAYNTEYEFVDQKVTFDTDTQRYYFVDDFAATASQSQANNEGQPGQNNNQNSTPSRIHDSYINAGKGNDIIIAGQGRDEIRGGQGDDFIDGGSESEFLASLDRTATDTPSQLLANPDTGLTKKYKIYSVDGEAGQKLWAWDDNVTNPDYFEVTLNDGSSKYEATTKSQDQFDNWKYYDRAMYDGYKIRYDISEVYLKMDNGRPDLTSDGAYQEISTTAWTALSTADKADYSSVVKIKDLLPTVAGGDGTDYLMNIEEVSFEDGHEQLEIEIWGWDRQEVDWSLVDAAAKTDDSVYNRPWDELARDYGVVISEANYRGTLKHDTLGGPSPTKVVADELWGQAGNDLMIGGAGMDRAKGGAGDDVFWGGSHAGGNPWDFSGDTAFFTGGASRYQVVRNVFVHADSEHGQVTKDASGKVMLYCAYDADDVFTLTTKGVVANSSASIDGAASANLTTADLVAGNGFYAATIVVDSLGASTGGEGVDALIGVERLVFGHAESGDFGWLPNNPEHEQDAGYTVNTLAVSSQAESFKNWDWQTHQEVDNFKVTYTGTGYNDDIAYADDSPFTAGDTTVFTADQATEFNFNGGAGDDTFTGSSADGVQNYAVYNGAAGAYSVDIERDASGDISYVTVTHNVPDDMDGTGVDTLYNIDGAVFSYHTSSETRVNFTPKYASQDWNGNKVMEVSGSRYGDRVAPVATDGSTPTDVASSLNSISNLFRPNGGVDTFDGGTTVLNGGEGADWVMLSGMPTRYHYVWDAANQDIVVIDKLAHALGGDGHITLQNATTGGLGANVDYIGFDGPFYMNLVFNDDGSLRTKADLGKDVLRGNDQTYTAMYDQRDLTGINPGEPTLFSGLEALATDVDADNNGYWDITELSKTIDYNGDGSADYSVAPTYFASLDSDNNTSDMTAVENWSHDMETVLGAAITFDATTDSLAESDWNGEGYQQHKELGDAVSRESVFSQTYNAEADSWQDNSDDIVYSYNLFGYGSDDRLLGGDQNDTFSGAPGNDYFDGRGDKKGDWWDAWNNGDVVEYSGYLARYSINNLVDEDGSITGTEGLNYFTVVDSLAAAFGGDGTDTLVNIERIQFSDQSYFLSIRDMTNEWDSNARLIGTSGNDDFTSYTALADKDYFINPGAGNDLIIGKAEGTDTWGDAAVFDGAANYFDITVKKVTFTSLEDSLEATLRERFADTDADNDATETIDQVVVTDRRTSEAGGLGENTLYGIERIEFQANNQFTQYDIKSTQQDWDGDGKIDDFRGTNFGDRFDGDAGDTYIEARGGDDIILAGDGADNINAGGGNDFVNGGDNGAVDDYGWGGRDEVQFKEATYARVEVEGVKIVLESDGTAKLADDGSWKVYEYSGDEALNSSAVTVMTEAAPDDAVDAYLITDTLPSDETGSVGTNLIVNVEAIGFSDQFLDLQSTTSTWEWTDWYTGETFSESYQRGTPFADTITGGNGTDTLEGEAGNDYLSAGAGGDRLRGGVGDDLIDGGADGTSGDSWRDMDVAEYGGIEARYTVYTVKVALDGDGKPTVTDGKYNVYDTGTVVTADSVASMTSYNVTQGAVPDGVGDLSTAFIVSDALMSALGGHGDDLLINVEQAQFSDGQMDLGFRVMRQDWDGDGNLDMVEVLGTDGADNMTAAAWGDGTDANSDGESDDVALENQLRGKGGNDVIEGGSGGDRISGGAGNDFIDGGANGTVDDWGFIPKDEAMYDGASRNFTVTTYTYTAGATTDDNTAIEAAVANTGHTGTLVSGQYTVVADSLPDAMGGAGTDVLTNIEFLAFQDAFVPLAMEEWIDYQTIDGVQTEVRRFVKGTDAADTINGGDGNDDLWGNSGDDTITAGAGGDFIQGGAGDDIIDGGSDGVDEWSGQIIGDRVKYDGDYGQFEIEDTLVSGVSTLIVTDTEVDGEGQDTITNVEILEFDDRVIRVGVEQFTHYAQDGETVRNIHYDGSIFGDTVTGTSASEYMDGGDGADTLYGLAGPDTFNGGAGNDTIYGGENGLDEWGNAGQDVAEFSGAQSRYTVTHYDSAGSAATSYQADGYMTVEDTNTTEGEAEGTDTLYGIESLSFDGDYVSFLSSNTFVDFDGDGIADVGDQRGTSGSDELVGQDIDETLDGAGGNDILWGNGGSDFILPGLGTDYVIGGADGVADKFGRSDPDVVKLAGNKSSYTYTETGTYWFAQDADGNFAIDDAGTLLVYGATAETGILADSAIAEGYTKVGLVLFANADATDVNYIAQVERIEFLDGVGRFDAELKAEDIDYDGVADTAQMVGAMGADTFTEANIDASLLPEWADAAAVFAADNFIDGGAGADTIETGAGDDTIETGAKTGDADDKVDGGTGNDTVYMAGVEANWFKEDGTGDYVGYDAWTSTNGTGDATDDDFTVYLKNVEGLEFSDGFLGLTINTLNVDIDEDGVVDEYVIKGTANTGFADGVYEELTATAGAHTDTIDGGAGDDLISTGDGADTLIGGAGSDFMIGGANTGTDDSGNALKDTAVYDGRSTNLDADGDGTNEASLQYTVANVGVAIRTAVDATTGAETFIDGDTNNRPDIYTSATAVYVAQADQTVAAANSGDIDGDGTVDTVFLDTNNDGTNDTYFIDEGQDGKADTFDSQDDTDFSAATMTIDLAHNLVVTDAATSTTTMRFDVDKVEQVYTVSNSEDSTELDYLIGVETIEFTDTMVNLGVKESSTTTFSLATGLTNLTNLDGSTFADHLHSDAGTDIMQGGGGLDEFCFEAGSGADQILDFNTTGVASVADGTVDTFEKLLIVRDVNGSGITTEANALSRVTSTADGALVNLGSTTTDGVTTANTILLVGIDADTLTVDHFEIADPVLMDVM